MFIEDTSQYAGVIYGFHNGDYDYRYIGKTVMPLRRRVTNHLSDLRNGKGRPLYYWMRKHGQENIQICVIETFDETTIHLIEEREIFHISQNKWMVEGNLNLTGGGEGTTGRVMTPETRKKISESKAGKTHPYIPRRPKTEAQKEHLRERGHNQWHTKLNKTNPLCTYCVSAA